jgi:flagellar basal-body rod protein FlgG
MVRGIYTALMGMLVDQAIVDNTSNNLANADTTGFKRDTQAFRSYLQHEILRIEASEGKQKRTPLGTLERGVTLDEVRSDITQGAVEMTEVNTDFAIQGDGFFAVQTENGDTYYTRNGNAKINVQRFLINNNGDYYLTDTGEAIRFTGDTVVDRQGNIVTDGIIQGRMGIYAFEAPRYLEKVGYTYYKTTEGSGEPEADIESSIYQGYEEKATVNSVREMVNLINAQRHFDLNQKVIMTEDTLLDSAINKVGSVRS